jgi:hypothetical protein
VPRSPRSRSWPRASTRRRRPRPAAPRRPLLATQVDTPRSPSNLSLEPNEILERTHVFRVSKQDWDVVTLAYYAVFNSQRQPAPNPEYLERRFDPDGVTLLPLLPKGVRGTLSTSNTTSRAIVVLPR